MNRFPCTLCGSREWPRENAGCPLCEMPDEDEKSCPEGLHEPTCSGFLIKMRDGTQYLIPTAKFIEAEIAYTINVWNKEMEVTGEETPASPEEARKWAKDKFSRPMHPADIEDLFAGTEWSEFADVAIKLPTEPLSPDELWDETAKISFLPNVPVNLPTNNPHL